MKTQKANEYPLLMEIHKVIMLSENTVAYLSEFLRMFNNILLRNFNSGKLFVGKVKYIETAFMNCNHSLIYNSQNLQVSLEI